MNAELVNGFIPEKITAPIHSFWAEDTLSAGVDKKLWKKITSDSKNSTVQIFPGNHFTMLHNENVDMIAAKLNQLLKSPRQYKMAK